ncbi:Cell wall assembly regulator [Tulasnella sp. 427]|nr:Cell wall assembly regulator [Tulasnella sp. 427]
MPTFLQTIASIFGGTSNNRDSLPTSTAPPTRIRGKPPNSPSTGAFSFQTHAPIFGDASETSAGMNAASSSTTAFSYPPPSNGYDYDYPVTTGQKLARALSPTSRGGRPQSGSPILPLHGGPNSIHNQANLSPLQSYPPLNHTWYRLKAWLSNEYTELGDTLNYGIDPSVIAQVQMELGLPLPSAVRDSYLICDGQEVESSAGCSDGLFFGLTLLPLEDVLEEWRFWREVDEDPATGANERLRAIMKSIPDGYIRKEYSCRGWLPLVTDRAGNYLGVDLHPGDGGTYGQVIVFGRDFDTKVVLWRGEGEGGWGRWLAGFVDELENGEGYELGGGDGSSGSEDDVGYEGYFYSSSGGGVRDGAEGGPGGLRLTGEYKGWNVLEAWADRSVKKWTEAGLYKEEEQSDAVAYPHPEIEITDAATAIVTNNAPAVEVPIPVLGSEIDLSVAAAQRLPSSNASEATVTPTAPSPQPPPTAAPIAPKPKPVPIPTAVDLLGGNSPDVSVPSSPQQDKLTTSVPGGTSNSKKSRQRLDDGAAAAPLVADTSFESRESSMSEAELLPAGTANPDESILAGLASPPKSGGKIPAASIVPLKPVIATSPVAEDFESKTPRVAEFVLSNGASSSPSAPAPSGSKPSPTKVSLPGSEPASPIVPRGASGSAASKSDSRSTAPTSERLQQGLHKKSTRSISKLFGGQVGDKDKERESGSVKGSDEESIKDSARSKRGSALGSSLKPVGSGKPKEKKKDLATAAG